MRGVCCILMLAWLFSRASRTQGESCSYIAGGAVKSLDCDGSCCRTGQVTHCCDFASSGLKSQSSTYNSRNIGAIVGGIIAFLVVVGIVVVIIFCCCCRSMTPIYTPIINTDGNRLPNYESTIDAPQVVVVPEISVTDAEEQDAVEEITVAVQTTPPQPEAVLVDIDTEPLVSTDQRPLRTQPAAPQLDFTVGMVTTRELVLETDDMTVRTETEDNLTNVESTAVPIVDITVDTRANEDIEVELVDTADRGDTGTKPFVEIEEEHLEAASVVDRTGSAEEISGIPRPTAEPDVSISLKEHAPAEMDTDLIVKVKDYVQTQPTIAEELSGFAITKEIGYSDLMVEANIDIVEREHDKSEANFMDDETVSTAIVLEDGNDDTVVLEDNSVVSNEEIVVVDTVVDPSSHTMFVNGDVTISNERPYVDVTEDAQEMEPTAVLFQSEGPTAELNLNDLPTAFDDDVEPNRLNELRVGETSGDNEAIMDLPNFDSSIELPTGGLRKSLDLEARLDTGPDFMTGILADFKGIHDTSATGPNQEEIVVAMVPEEDRPTSEDIDSIDIVGDYGNEFHVSEPPVVSAETVVSDQPYLAAEEEDTMVLDLSQFRGHGESRSQTDDLTTTAVDKDASISSEDGSTGQNSVASSESEDSTDSSDTRDN